MKWSGQCTHPSWRPTNMQIYAHQKVKVLEVTIKTRKTPEWSTYFCAKKINAGQRSNVVSGEGNGSEGKGQEQEVPSTSGMECRRLPRRWNTIKPH